MNLIFKEYYEGIVVGDKYQKLDYSLKPKEKTTVAVEVKKDLKLKLEEYTYNISEKNNDKYYKNYTIFINEAKYNIEEYQNIEERNPKNLIFSTICFVCMTIIGILDILYTRLEKKIKLEENEAYQDKCKVIKRIRMVVFIIYMVCGIYFVLHH